MEPGKPSKVLVVAMFLAFGISTSHFSERVCEDGCALQIKMKRPNALEHVKYLYRKRFCSEVSNHFEFYFLKMIGVANHLKSSKFNRPGYIETSLRNKHLF